jgi:hypothetical protein
MIPYSSRPSDIEMTYNQRAVNWCRRGRIFINIPQLAIAFSSLVWISTIAYASDYGDLANAINQAILSRATAASDVVVQLPARTYRLDAPISIINAQSSNGVNIRLLGATSGITRITGSFPYSYRLPTTSDAMPATVNRANVRVIDMDTTLKVAFSYDPDISRSTGAHPGPQIFQNGVRFRPARWPKTGYLTGTSTRLTSTSAASVVIDRTKSKLWMAENDLRISGYFTYDWWYETAKILGINASASTMSFSLPPSRYAPVSGMKFAVNNIFSELSSPGEYFIDRANRKIFLIPLNKSASNSLEIALTTNLFSLYDTSNFSFENIAFDSTLDNIFNVTMSSNITITNSYLGHAGNAAAIFYVGQNNTISNNVIRDAGSFGIYCHGGDRASLASANDTISNNVITDFSVLFRTYTPAVDVEGDGVTVSGNYISGSPHSAILISGNNHTIIGNEISNVVTETSDSGVIYGGRDWTQRGTQIIYNYFHDIRSFGGQTISGGTPTVSGVYLDDMLSGTAVTANIFDNVMNPVYIGGGRDNSITRNIFSRPIRYSISGDGRGMSWGTSLLPTLYSNLAQVPYRTAAWASAYPRLAAILANNPAQPLGNAIEKNTVIQGLDSYFSADGAAYIKPSKSVAVASLYATNALQTYPTLKVLLMPPLSSVITDADLISHVASMDRATALAGLRFISY